MIITIALGVMLRLFLTARVARVLSDEGCVTGLAWTVGIIVALIVPLQLPTEALGIALLAAVGPDLRGVRDCADRRRAPQWRVAAVV